MKKFAVTDIHFLTALDAVESLVAERYQKEREGREGGSGVYCTGTIVNYKPLL